MSSDQYAPCFSRWPRDEFRHQPSHVSLYSRERGARSRGRDAPRRHEHTERNVVRGKLQTWWLRLRLRARGREPRHGKSQSGADRVARADGIGETTGTACRHEGQAEKVEGTKKATQVVDFCSVLRQALGARRIGSSGFDRRASCGAGTFTQRPYQSPMRCTPRCEFGASVGKG